MTDDDARRNVSVNIARILKARGWNTLRLAETVVGDAPTTQNTIYRIVRGESYGSVPVLAAIAEALCVTVDYLISDPEVHARKRGHKSASDATH